MYNLFLRLFGYKYSVRRNQIRDIGMGGDHFSVYLYKGKSERYLLKDTLLNLFFVDINKINKINKIDLIDYVRKSIHLDYSIKNKYIDMILGIRENDLVRNSIINSGDLTIVLF